MMKPKMGRSSIIAVVGGYLIYMDYEMLRDLINHVPTTMPQFLQILVGALFTGIGITLLVFAWKLWKKGREDQDQNPVDLDKQEAEAKNEEEPLKSENVCCKKVGKFRTVFLWYRFRKLRKIYLQTIDESVKYGQFISG